MTIAYMKKGLEFNLTPLQENNYETKDLLKMLHKDNYLVLFCNTLFLFCSICL